MSRTPTILALLLALAYSARVPAQVRPDDLALVVRTPSFLRGDSNGDGKIDMGDPISLLGCLFAGGACPSCEDGADANDDGRLDMSDSIFLLAWLFLGGPAPADPGPQECGPDPTADKLAACVYRRTGCDPVEEVDPARADVLSRLHWAAVAAPERFVEPDDDAEYRRPSGSHGPREVPYVPREGKGFSWSSPLGRRILMEYGSADPDTEGSAFHSTINSLEHQVETVAEEHVCIEPQHYVEASDRVFQGWDTQVFKAPKNAFASDSEATEFLLSVHAEQPFFLPFSDSSVKLGHGWFYNSGGLHRACDYSRSGVEENEDPTFEVRSSSWGVVAAVTWDDNGGNLVAVEHTAAGGQKVMICYLHLRNGRVHDVAEAKDSTSDSEKYVKYRAFARDYPNHLSWGTESHKIKVTVGQHVAPGTLLGYAGNTGAGGAGSGLNADGSPKNWKGNIHLHVYFAVPHPDTENTWVWVDPYGVYDEVEHGCYDLLKSTKFSRLYAPFYPTFHGVPYEIYKFYFGYYPNMGYKLQTLNVHRKDSKLLVSGSFQGGLSGSWYVHSYMSADRFQTKANEYWAKGYIPRETTVAKTLGGEPRWTAIWRKVKGGEHVEHRGALTVSEWPDKWQERVVEDEWRVEDYSGYTIGTKEYISALYTDDDPRPFLLHRNRTSAEMDAIVEENTEKGMLPVNFNVAELSGGRRYTGIFRNVPGFWKVFWGRSPSVYQDLVEQQVALGYRVHKIQGYANSSKYAVIFTRN